MRFVSNRDNIDKGPIYQFSSFFSVFYYSSNLKRKN